MRRLLASIAGGALVVVGVVVGARHAGDGPATVRCVDLEVAARWSAGDLVIPEAVLRLETPMLRDCNVLDGGHIVVALPDGGQR